MELPHFTFADLQTADYEDDPFGYARAWLIAAWNERDEDSEVMALRNLLDLHSMTGGE